MATNLFDATLTQAQLAALAPNTYYWIADAGDGTARVQSVGGSALVATASVPPPEDHGVLELSQWQAVEMFITHGVLTTAAGGKVSVADLSPDLSLGIAAGTCQVFGATTTDQALAATAESLITAIVNPATVGRRIKAAVAILFTTVPTAGSGIRITVWGHRDGQMPARG